MQIKPTYDTTHLQAVNLYFQIVNNYQDNGILCFANDGTPLTCTYVSTLRGVETYMVEATYPGYDDRYPITVVVLPDGDTGVCGGNGYDPCITETVVPKAVIQIPVKANGQYCEYSYQMVDGANDSYPVVQGSNCTTISLDSGILLDSSDTPPLPTPVLTHSESLFLVMVFIVLLSPPFFRFLFGSWGRN